MALSCNQAAAQFGVGISTAINWVRRLRETGSVKPDKVGGYRPKKIAGPHRDWLVQRCRKADFTLRGLVAELAERGLKVDYRTVWGFRPHEAAKAELKSLVIAPDLERLGPHGRKPAARPLVRGSSIQPWQPHVPDEPSGSAGLEIGAWRDRTSVEFDKNATVRKAINSAIFPLF